MENETLAELRRIYAARRVDFASLTSPEVSNLKDKTVLITGGSKGLGASCAVAFAKAGAIVTIADIDQENGQSFAEANNLQFVKCDVTSWDDLVAAFKAAIANSPHKTIDIVVANAGIPGRPFFNPKAISDEPSPPSLAVLQVNLIAVYNTAYLALHYFQMTSGTQKPDKSLILIGSAASYITHTPAVNYAAAKYGVRGMFKSLEGQLGQMVPNARVRLNMLAPVFMKTNILSQDKGLIQALEHGGVRFAELDLAVQAVAHMACNTDIDCRSVAVLPDGLADMGDDVGSDDGSTALWDSIANQTVLGRRFMLDDAGIAKEKAWGNGRK